MRKFVKFIKGLDPRVDEIERGFDTKFEPINPSNINTGIMIFVIFAVCVLMFSG